MLSQVFEEVERWISFANNSDLRHLISEKLEFYVNNPLDCAGEVWSAYLTLVLSVLVVKRVSTKMIRAYEGYKKLLQSVIKISTA